MQLTPKIAYQKGDKKEDINKRLISSLIKSVAGIRKKLLNILETIEEKAKSYESKLASPFVPSDKTSLAIAGISEQIARLQHRIKDCERLEALCRR
jgi:MoxR-like ATPase